LAGKTPPPVLKLLFFGIPVALLILLGIDVTSSRVLVTLLNVPVLVISFVAGTAIVAWAALRHANGDARLMLPAYFLVCCFLVRDIWQLFHPAGHSLILMTPYVRPVFLGAVLVVLMRRLATSLDRVDRANETLQLKLAEREAELANLHQIEQQEAARLVREHERQRLTRDLHDGISGHLVSIIAMSEQGGDTAPIEQAAREALDDLRLVIYSLDLGDRELPLALANFRERLTPQLRRMGVDLDWSTATLPEVSGVTPANALVVLRILQEAITNALKHGPAKRIVVRAASRDDDSFSLIVENDGGPFAGGKYGRGIDNMRQRASQLLGCVAIDPCPEGTRLTLTLPRNLTALQEQPIS
jgi:signal transduction histidine kinase